MRPGTVAAARHPPGGAVKSALQAAGNLNWNTATDPHSTHEVLLNVATL